MQPRNALLHFYMFPNFYLGNSFTRARARKKFKKYHTSYTKVSQLSDF